MEGWRLPLPPPLPPFLPSSLPLLLPLLFLLTPNLKEYLMISAGLSFPSFLSFLSFLSPPLPLFSLSLLTSPTTMPSSRFILNVPDEEKKPSRICFQIQDAYWHYLDLVLKSNKSLPKFDERTFAKKNILSCLPFALCSFSLGCP